MQSNFQYLGTGGGLGGSVGDARQVARGDRQHTDRLRSSLKEAQKLVEAEIPMVTAMNAKQMQRWQSGRALNVAFATGEFWIDDVEFNVRISLQALEGQSQDWVVANFPYYTPVPTFLDSPPSGWVFVEDGMRFTDDPRLSLGIRNRELDLNGVLFGFAKSPQEVGSVSSDASVKIDQYVIPGSAYSLPEPVPESRRLGIVFEYSPGSYLDPRYILTTPSPIVVGDLRRGSFAYMDIGGKVPEHGAAYVPREEYDRTLRYRDKIQGSHTIPATTLPVDGLPRHLRVRLMMRVPPEWFERDQQPTTPDSE